MMARTNENAPVAAEAVSNAGRRFLGEGSAIVLAAGRLRNPAAELLREFFEAVGVVTIVLLVLGGLTR